MHLRPLALAPALLLAACGTPNRGLESVHQPVVQRADYAFDVATDGRGLAAGEVQRLAGWMGSLGLGYGDRVALDAGSAEVGGVRDDVAQAAARYGLLLSEDMPVSAGTIAPGTARVVVSRMRASVPGCPDHSRVSGIEFNSNSNSNYGCAANANLAAMVARPEDLVRGQAGSGVADPATAYKAIDTLRKATPGQQTALPSASTRTREQ